MCFGICVSICMPCSVSQSCPTLCDPMDCSLPGSSVHGVSKARILEWIAISSSRGSSHPGIKPRSSEWAGSFFTTKLPGKPIYLYSLYILNPILDGCTHTKSVKSVSSLCSGIIVVRGYKLFHSIKFDNFAFLP